MPSYCNWRRGSVRLSTIEYTCHSDKEDFILVAKGRTDCEVRIPANDAIALRDNLNDYIAMKDGHMGRRYLEYEMENAKLSSQVADLKHRLKTMRGVLDKAISALN